ncbi:hypothetical protein ACTHQF_00420 [Pedobacter sp. SAFR-022]|jgi:hypothetical protein|uniref:hypothetical protein n=1 Tax=Pedobacter sp. SAFR-022 TaxID=3436861 RepID=UPI003F7D3363
MKQFRIEIPDNDTLQIFSITELGDNQYEIHKAGERIGMIQIDGESHEHCKTVDCEIDLPLLNSIREAILVHRDLA